MKTITQLQEVNTKLTTTISNDLLFNNKLSNAAKILFISFMNTPSGEHITLYNARKRVGIKHSLATKAMKELTINGYVASIKRRNVIGKGYYYEYTFSNEGKLLLVQSIVDLCKNYFDSTESNKIRDILNLLKK